MGGASTRPRRRPAGLFDGLVKNQLAGKLVDVKDGVATFTVTGTTEGIDHGAKVALTVSATGKFHTASLRVTELTWKQSDDRDQGAVSPVSRLDATVTVRREVLPTPPPDLADPALAGVPKAEPPVALTHLHCTKTRRAFATGSSTRGTGTSPGRPIRTSFSGSTKWRACSSPRRR